MQIRGVHGNGEDWDPMGLMEFPWEWESDHGMGIGWEWELSAWKWELRRGNWKKNAS